MSYRKIVKEITREELLEIRKENQRKLDHVFSQPNWRKYIGIKHYGEENWQKMMFGEKHPDYKDWQDDEQRDKTPMTELPLGEYDLDGNHIRDWKNVQEVCEHYGWGDLQGRKQNIIECIRSKRDSAYGRQWKIIKK